MPDKTLTRDDDFSSRKSLTDQVRRLLFVTSTELIADSVYFDGPVIVETNESPAHRIHQGALKSEIQNLLPGVRQYLPVPVAPGAKTHQAIQDSPENGHQKNSAVIALRKYSRCEQSLRVKPMVSKTLHGLLPAVEPVG